MSQPHLSIAMRVEGLILEMTIEYDFDTERASRHLT